MSAGPDPATPDVVEPSSRRVTRAHERRRARSTRRFSIVGALGELLITAGVVVLLFIGWQLWFTELTVGHEQRVEANEQSKAWNEQVAASTPPAPLPSDDPSDEPTDEPSEPTDLPWIEPPVEAAPAANQRLGMLIVPRWGADYYRTIAEGISMTEVLDRGRLGRYSNTSMPGAVGNFAIAAHRMGHGGSLHYVDELRLGDHIYVETASGWYQYEFRNLEYVRPTGVGVLDPVPQSPSTPPTERYITLTSCNPEHTSHERIIAYGVLTHFFPRDAAVANFGAPDEIASTVGGSA
jgi:sortase A